ncbi:hypothetical protein FAES_4060 [Fibrella aestuarina BUZ 2]|uniref:GIY-YIG domain-containing protein n=1 Tax=Fibrella aestuarina BUZ 2 TaxID=1166018 RepID=I0KD57_9BACT|nr:hypothetical protein [Fibrella aestuarina]CCH02060.1 hypothetical protein FAES_4060 [Fibrella aestuarina BUZ 2]
MATQPPPEGEVYLIHLNTPMSHAQHYIGWAKEVEKRLFHHRNGTGSRMLAVAAQRGIDFDVVRRWIGDRHFERKLKNRHKARMLCPICNPPKS